MNDSYLYKIDCGTAKGGSLLHSILLRMAENLNYQIIALNEVLLLYYTYKKIVL